MRQRRILLAATLLILVVAVRPVSGAGIYEERVRIAIEKYVKEHGLRFVPSDTAPLDEVRKISAEIDAGRDGRQSDASALAGAFTSLLDQPSTTNFLALALQSGAFQEERQGEVVTLTGSLYAVKRFISPKPWRSMEEYAADRNLRRLTGSLSFGEVTADEAETERDVQSWTVRYTFGSRDLRDFYRDPDFGPMAALHKEILNVLFEALDRRHNRQDPDAYTEVEIASELESGELWEVAPEVAVSLPGGGVNRASLPMLVAAFSNALETFVQDETKRARRRVVGSIALAHTRPAGGEPGTYQLQGSGQKSFSDDGLLTVNITGRRTEAEGDTQSGDPNAELRYGVVVATELAWTFREFRPLGDGEGTRIALVGNVEAGQAQKPVFKGQGRVELLLPKGVSIPLSITWANRTDLIDESVVRGSIGISFDAASLLKISAGR